MLRSLALVSLASASLVWFRLLRTTTPRSSYAARHRRRPDMADDGTGGNGGTGGSGGGGGDMARRHARSGRRGHGSGAAGPRRPAARRITIRRSIRRCRRMTRRSRRQHHQGARKCGRSCGRATRRLGDKVNTFNDVDARQRLLDDRHDGLRRRRRHGQGQVIVLTTRAAGDDHRRAARARSSTANIGKTAGWPTKNANTIISFVLDPKTVGDAGRSAGRAACSSTATTASRRRARCRTSSTRTATTRRAMPDWNNLTVTMSHETAEAAGDWDLAHNRVVDTDTGTAVSRRWRARRPLHQPQRVDQVGGAATRYLVQRLWSDSAAAKNNVDPCLPVDDGHDVVRRRPVQRQHRSVDHQRSPATRRARARRRSRSKPFSYGSELRPDGLLRRRLAASRRA